MNPTRSHRWLVTAALVTMLALLAPTAALPDSGPDAFKAWQKRWGQMLNSMSRVKLEKHITYDRQRTPRQGSVVTLPDPLPTRQDIDVEVEWFFTYLSDSNNLSKVNRIFDWWIGFWRENLRQHGIDNVRIVRTPVSHIEGLEGNWDEHRERHLEVVLSFGGPDEDPGGFIHEKILLYLADRNTALSLHTAADAERFIASHRWVGHHDLLKRYRGAAGTPELAARMEANNDRLAQVLKQAAKINPSTTLSPHDPIFLINGKYLVTGSNARRNNPAAVFQTVNKLIADELGDRWTLRDARWAAHRTTETATLRPNHIDPISFGYSDTKHAKLRKVIPLDPPLSTPSAGVHVELFFSPETLVNQLAKKLFHRWRRTWPETISSSLSPIQRPRVSNPEISLRHQEIMVAGRPVFWEDTLMETMRGRLSYRFRDRRIKTEEDLSAFLAELKMPRSDYDKGLHHPDTVARLRTINDAWARITDAATSDRNPDMRRADPVLVINGRHLLVGHRFKNWKQLFHTANALLERPRN